MAGRPSLPASEKRSRKLQIPVTEAEEKTVKAAARKAGKPLAEWVRDLAVGTARAAKGKA